MKTAMMAMTAAVTLGIPIYADTASDSGAVLIVDQGWDEAARNTFYHAPQGSPIMPYAFFLALEQAESEAMFRDLEHLEGHGMLYWGTSSLNPDGLPIGLTVDNDINGVESQLGMNCAACHVTEIKVGGRTALVDGGVSHFNFWSFMQDLLVSLRATHSDDKKFDRFARRVLADDYTPEAAQGLRARLRGVVRAREDWADRNTAPIIPGPGRVDALNVILNQTTAGMLGRPDNARPVNAPVSYPFLWDAPYLERVQYNGVVPNLGAGALGRNVGQVLGVFGEVSVQESTLPGGYASSVRIDHLNDLEDTLRTLTSPRWEDFSAQGLLPEINRELSSKGQPIYARECAQCHEVIDNRSRGDLASIEVPVFGMDEIGTDPAAALGFAARSVATGPLMGRKSGYVEGEPMCEYVHGNTVLAHLTVGVIMHDLSASYKPVLSSIKIEVASGLRQEVHALEERVLSIFGMRGNQTHAKKAETDQQLISRLRAAGASNEDILKALEERSANNTALYEQLVADGLAHHGEDAVCLETLQTAQYRSRPLNGIWATGPYLHNGSVPTLSDLLKAPSERPVLFVVGDSTLDPVAVGFVAPKQSDGFLLDTSLPGNLNGGHTYGIGLSEADKAALLEYLKTL
jgi:hypothetical protein